MCEVSENFEKNFEENFLTRLWYNSTDMKQENFTFRCIAYKEKDDTFTGVCLDLDIVEEGHITLQEAILSINDAIQSHIQASAKLGYPQELMFRPAPKEYWNKLKDITDAKPLNPPLETFRFFTAEPYAFTPYYV